MVAWARSCSRDSCLYTDKGCVTLISLVNSKLDLHRISLESTDLFSQREVWFQAMVQ